MDKSFKYEELLSNISLSVFLFIIKIVASSKKLELHHLYNFTSSIIELYKSIIFHDFELKHTFSTIADNQSIQSNLLSIFLDSTIQSL
jgi:hypothetical protein